MDDRPSVLPQDDPAESCYESGTKWGRLRGQLLVIGGVGEVGVPAVEVVGEVVVEDSGT